MTDFSKVYPFLVAILLMGCSETPKDSITTYFDAENANRILLQVIRYNYYNEGIPANDRFNSKYDSKYDQLKSSFQFHKYSITKSGEHIFILYRLHHKDKYRATGGQIKLDSNNKVISYQEIFVTPLLKLNELNQRTDFLFQELAQNGEIPEKYLEMRTYVEWPNESQRYDTIKHEWIFIK
jgi:hypothetical protein